MIKKITNDFFTATLNRSEDGYAIRPNNQDYIVAEVGLYGFKMHSSPYMDNKNLHGLCEIMQDCATNFN